MFQLITLLVVGLTTFAVSDIEYNTTDDVEIMEMRTENQRVVNTYFMKHFVYMKIEIFINHMKNTILPQKMQEYLVKTLMYQI